jgi:GDP-L-fucose synthase
MNKNDEILVLGGSGLVGSAIIRDLKRKGYKNVLSPRSTHLNLLSKTDVCAYMATNQPDVVIMAAAKVGGIAANMESPADFGFLNGMMNLNVIDCAYRNGVKKLLFLGSSCIYPRDCKQPMVEEDLMKGPCEPTNEMYALSKIYGLKLCEAYNTQYKTNFISCQPCNIYGEGDHFDLKNSHVMGALINKFHNAKITSASNVVIWGDGTARREFLYVDDCADACTFLLENYNESQFLNVGTGEDISIKDLSNIIKDIVGYEGKLIFDTSKPNGMPRKLLDTTKINNLGWKATTSLEDGIKKTYNWYIKNVQGA